MQTPLSTLQARVKALQRIPDEVTRTATSVAKKSKLEGDEFASIMHQFADRGHVLQKALANQLEDAQFVYKSVAKMIGFDASKTPPEKSFKIVGDFLTQFEIADGENLAQEARRARALRIAALKAKDDEERARLKAARLRSKAVYRNVWSSLGFERGDIEISSRPKSRRRGRRKGPASGGRGGGDSM